MTINRQAIQTPRPGDEVTVRTTVGPQNGGRSAYWAMKMTALGIWVPGDFTIQLTGQIIAADFNMGLDERITNQKDSVSRLLEHLKVHCPELNGAGKKCSHIGGVAVAETQGEVL